MAKKLAPIVYTFDDLKTYTENYGGFQYETAGSVIHSHKDYYELALILSGEYQHTISGVTLSTSVGTLLLFKPGVTHLLHTDSPKSRHFVFGVKQDYFEEYVQRVFPDLLLDSFEEYTSRIIDKKKIDYIQHLASGIMEKPKALRIMADELLSSCLYDFMYSFEKKDCNIYVSDIISKINNHMYLNLDVKDICKNYPVSRPSISRQFKQTTGQTIEEYKRAQKLEYACQLLTNTTLSCAKIASHIRYDSPSYFNRAFRAQYSMTPLEYREQTRGEAKRTIT